MKKARYIRQSTKNQTNLRQLAKVHPDEELFIDIISGSIPFADRPEGKRLIQAVEAGEINYVSFHAIDRAGRNNFIGLIDDIGIWNRALTQEEITNLYNSNQCITNITVTDTLIINVGQLSFNDPVTWANNITIAPNPASSQININFNNITNLNGGTLKIINSLGQQVATTPITTSGTNSTMQLATWGGTGMYFVQIINPQGQIVDIKKIILQ
jgi:hypothetical protein